VFLFLFSLSSLAQDTYSYGFNFDVKGYDVIPITHICPSADPLNEECVAVGTVYKSLGNDDRDNGLHFIHFDKKGNIFASKYFNHLNADERAIKILSIDNSCRFVIVSLFREYANGSNDAIKLTTINLDGNILNETIINSTHYNYKHLYPMDAAIKDGIIYIVGSAVDHQSNSTSGLGFGLNFLDDNRSFVYKADIFNLSNNELFIFGNGVLYPYFNNNSIQKNACFNIARSIKFTPDGRIFILGAANSLFNSYYPYAINYELPSAMIAEINNSNGPISIINYKEYKDQVSAFVGTIAVDLYYDPHTDSMNLLVNDVKVEFNFYANIYQHQSLLPWDAYRVYKINKANLNHSITNEFQPFDNLYATNFIEQSNGNLKVVGWQYTSDASNTTPTTIFRDCPFIQNVKIDNNVSNFMLPISLNTLVDGTLNLTNPYQSVGGSSLSSIWELPRVGSLSGAFDNVVLTGTHLLNNPTFGLKCIFTDNLGYSCNNQEMTYNKSFIIPLSPTTTDTMFAFKISNNFNTTFSDSSQFPSNLNVSCNNDNLFRKIKNLDSDINYSILPNVIMHGDGFNLFSNSTLKSPIKLSINIFNSVGVLVYKDLLDFSGNEYINPQIASPGMYFVECLIDGKLIKYKLVVN
jgi:hypothetical protein